MKFVLTHEEHKAFVKHLLEERKQEDILVDIFNEIGFPSFEGLTEKLTCRSFGILQYITPKAFAETDAFLDDFMGMDDFEAFYKKWYEVEK